MKIFEDVRCSKVVVINDDDDVVVVVDDPTRNVNDLSVTPVCYWHICC